jgi:hypothetical protein
VRRHNWRRGQLTDFQPAFAPRAVPFMWHVDADALNISPHCADIGWRLRESDSLDGPKEAQRTHEAMARFAPVNSQRLAFCSVRPAANPVARARALWASANSIVDSCRGTSLEIEKSRRKWPGACKSQAMNLWN